MWLSRDAVLIIIIKIWLFLITGPPQAAPPPRLVAPQLASARLWESARGTTPTPKPILPNQHYRINTNWAASICARNRCKNCKILLSLIMIKST